MRAAIMVWLMMAGAVLAAPAETPPADFTGAQYIDSAGCVFARDGTGWTPRLDTAGAVICGYPPTPTSRIVYRVEVEHEARPSPEEALAETLAHGLRDGELTVDPRPREERRAAPPVKTPSSSPLADLPGMVVAAPSLQRRMAADLNPNRRLCDLLGYPADAAAAPGLGKDATHGFCGGGEIEPLRRIAHLPTHEADQPAEAAPPTETATPSDPAARIPSRNNAKPVAGTPLMRTTRPAPSRQASRGVEMIPAGARFVHLGSFGDDQSRNAVIRRLRGLGYPVAQGRGSGQSGTMLYAGPFRDRRSLVAALNDLRARGIGRPVAR